MNQRVLSVIMHANSIRFFRLDRIYVYFEKTKTLRATSHLCDLQKLYLGESENISPSFQEMV